MKELYRVKGLDSPEAELYTEKCGACHSAKDPAMHTYEEWVKLVEKMVKIMSDEGMDPLQEEEKKQMLTFLKAQAKK